MSAEDKRFLHQIKTVACGSRLADMQSFIQHGSTSCLLHSIAVAYYSDRAASFLHITAKHRRELVRGALLHDYFLYDWHTDSPRDGLHGFTHPISALKNAERDFRLSDREKEIIRRHMFPLTPVPPRHLEGFIVSMVDKICSIRETLSRRPYRAGEIRIAYRDVLSGRYRKTAR